MYFLEKKKINLPKLSKDEEQFDFSSVDLKQEREIIPALSFKQISVGPAAGAEKRGPFRRIKGLMWLGQFQYKIMLGLTDLFFCRTSLPWKRVRAENFEVTKARKWTSFASRKKLLDYCTSKRDYNIAERNLVTIHRNHDVRVPVVDNAVGGSGHGLRGDNEGLRYLTFY